jgi:hypothetical protein
MQPDQQSACLDCGSDVPHAPSLCGPCLEGRARAGCVRPSDETQKLRRKIAQLERECYDAERDADDARGEADDLEKDRDYMRSAVYRLLDALDQPPIADLLDGAEAADSYAVRQVRRALRRVLGSAYGR